MNVQLTSHAWTAERGAVLAKNIILLVITYTLIKNWGLFQSPLSYNQMCTKFQLSWLKIRFQPIKKFYTNNFSVPLECQLIMWCHIVGNRETFYQILWMYTLKKYCHKSAFKGSYNINIKTLANEQESWVHKHNLNFKIKSAVFFLEKQQKSINFIPVSDILSCIWIN